MPGQKRSCTCGEVEITADPWDSRTYICRRCGANLYYADAEITYHDGAYCMLKAEVAA